MKIIKCIVFTAVMASLLCACNNQAVALPNNHTSQISSDYYGKVNLETIYNSCTAKSGDYIYFFDRIGIYKLNTVSSEVTVLRKLTYGYGMVLHNKYIYFIDSTDLCRINTDGNDFIKFPKADNISAYNHLELHNDTLNAFAVFSDNSSSSNYLSYDIKDDSNSLISSSTDGISSEELDKKRALSSFVEEKTTLSPNLFTVLNYSNKYIYFKELGNPSKNIKRIDINKETVEELKELYTIQSYFDVLDGWLYYWGKDGAMCRTKEDLSKTETIGIAGPPLKLNDIK